MHNGRVREWLAIEEANDVLLVDDSRWDARAGFHGVRM